nr:MAG TPA: hypothetical protein [Caudoviricetes sp.]
MTETQSPTAIILSCPQPHHSQAHRKKPLHHIMVRGLILNIYSTISPAILCVLVIDFLLLPIMYAYW